MSAYRSFNQLILEQQIQLSKEIGFELSESRYKVRKKPEKWNKKKLKKEITLFLKEINKFPKYIDYVKNERGYLYSAVKENFTGEELEKLAASLGFRLKKILNQEGIGQKIILKWN
ncbi:hypothetical protein [Rossellomorea sp. YZS02]|uniref:hypothetical protein n=1 Tax=Rossellomorea sp. YZS02 TaxID=3097358 RepID=UPI002A123152|nr:hypothetical protein [Rossellomorea sp. YZS02]MDX8345210.1 hypothetical protein [Rossellomorea sp. YZS02]